MKYETKIFWKVMAICCPVNVLLILAMGLGFLPMVICIISSFATGLFLLWREKQKNKQSAESVGPEAQ